MIGVVSQQSINCLIKDIISHLEDNSERLSEELMIIGEEQYKNGYGAIINALQEKYILIEKDDL
jgi:hypothetical protein